jgi:hypothetical protein
LRSRIGSAWAGALLAVAITAIVAAAAPAGPKFSLGAIRRDGLLIPFATFDGRGWSVPWPDSDLNVPLPISIGDVPRKWWGAQGPDVPWTAWIRDADPRPLKLVKPVHLSVFCGGHVALTTDYHGGPFDPKEPTVPKDGLAIAGDVKLETVSDVSVFAPEVKKLIAAITDDFNDEEELAAQHFTRWKHPFTAAERTQYPIELEALYRSVQTTARGSWRTSYIEAVRKFPARAGDQGCGLITFVRGWVTEAPPKKPVINIGARVTYCDRSDVSFMLPFGRLTIDKDVYWVYQVSSWRDEVYSVARVRPEDVVPVVAVAGGGCPKEPSRR